MADDVYVRLDERGVIGLAGEDARSFLQGLISNDVGRVATDNAIYGALLTAQGKFLHDFILAEWQGGLLLDCEAARLPDLLRRLTLYRLRAKVQLANHSESIAVYVLPGAGASDRLGLGQKAGATRPFSGGIALVDPRLPALGTRVYGPAAEMAAALAALGFRPGVSADYHAHRIALGIPDGSRDLAVEKAFLLENNFEEINGVDFKKGCYVGQELTARTKYRGLIRKRLFRVDAEGPLPPPGTLIMLGDKEAGVMYSGLGHSGLALLRLEQIEEAAQSGERLRAGDATLTPVKPAYAHF